MTRILLPIAVSAVLSACSQAPTQNEVDAAAAANIEATVAENSASDAARGLPHSDTPSPAKAAKTLPPKFLGRWGINKADCDLSRSDTKGLVTIFADKLSFYESTGKIATLAVESPDKVVADLDFTGEGQTWQTRTTLAIVKAGTALERTEQSPALKLLYERCA